MDASGDGIVVDSGIYAGEHQDLRRSGSLSDEHPHDVSSRAEDASPRSLSERSETKRADPTWTPARVPLPGRAFMAVRAIRVD